MGDRVTRSLGRVEHRSRALAERLEAAGVEVWLRGHEGYPQTLVLAAAARRAGAAATRLHLLLEQAPTVCES